MRRAIIIASSHDCAANLAGEAGLIADENLSPVLYLWENDPCIVIGRYQNPYAECDIQAMDRDHVQLVRRQSGGGAVYQDRGNICFTLIGDKRSMTKEENFAMVISALKTLGADATLSGRNDILVSGKKISGNAFQYTKDRFSHHGTLLISTDLSVMGTYLRPSKAKLESNAVASVRSRVGNLTGFIPGITNKMVFDAFCDAFIKQYGQTTPQIIDYSTDKEARKLYSLFGERTAILERTPPFTHRFSRRFPWAEVEVCMRVDEGVIKDLTIHSDALDTALVPSWRKMLLGIPYTKRAMESLSEQERSPETQAFLTSLKDEIPG